MALKAATGTTVSELREATSSGQPFLERLLFMNDHEDVEKQLLKVLEIFEHPDSDLEIFELEEDEDFENAPLDQCIISPDTLRNILSEWRKRQEYYTG